MCVENKCVKFNYLKLYAFELVVRISYYYNCMPSINSYTLIPILHIASSYSYTKIHAANNILEDSDAIARLAIQPCIIIPEHACM